MPPDPSFGPAGGPPGPGSPQLRFEVLARIAAGSTACVDLARSQGSPPQLIAVKRVLPELVHDEAVGKRFLDEVWMTAALRHPNVVSVVGWGQDDQGQYLAVELVQGVSLARLMKSVFETGEQFPERLVVYIGMSVARGLAAAHELRSDRGELLGLVHRDLSAANVLVGFQGDVKIADFGLAKAKDRLTVTTSELPMRSMGHVSPEELAQRPLDRRADIFALGVMLFELITGRNPFQGKDDLDTLEAVMRRAPVDPMVLRPKLDRSLAALILRCLEKERDRRPQRAEDIAAELDQWLYAHGYQKDSVEALGRFVRRNSMRQMRWFERVVAGEPEPAPAPYFAPKPSFYKPSGNPSNADTAETGGSRTTSPRESEPTVVERKPKSQAPPPRRSRSTDTFAALGHRGRRGSAGPDGAPFSLEDSSRRPFEPDVPNLYGGDEDENIPTIAMRVDPTMRAELKQRSHVRPSEPPHRGPLGTEGLSESVPTAPVVTAPVAPAPLVAAPPAPPPGAIPPHPPIPRPVDPHAAMERRSPQPRPAPRLAAARVERELDRLRELATAKHESARIARDAARRAAIEAEKSEAEARAVERAIAGARQALDLATRGHEDDANRRLDEALGALSPRLPSPPK